MRLAILGAGLAGLSSAYYALQKKWSVTLFDPNGVAGGATGAATGLMHPFAGKKATKSFRAEEGMEESNRLIRVSEKELSKKVVDRSGIFRPAVTERQKEDFQKVKDPLCIYRSMNLEGHGELEGLWIEEGVSFFPRVYLEGLFSYFKRNGGQFFQKMPESFEAYDCVIWALGSDIIQYDISKSFSFRFSLGQSLLCKTKREVPINLASEGHITRGERKDLCYIGSTYEHTKEPNPEKAKELLSKVSEFYAPAKEFEILEIRAGRRIAPKEGHTPICEKVDRKNIIFTGLGSRGLLYHALYGKELILNIN